MRTPTHIHTQSTYRYIQSRNSFLSMLTKTCPSIRHQILPSSTSCLCLSQQTNQRWTPPCSTTCFPHQPARRRSPRSQMCRRMGRRASQQARRKRRRRRKKKPARPSSPLRRTRRIPPSRFRYDLIDNSLGIEIFNWLPKCATETSDKSLGSFLRGSPGRKTTHCEGNL